MRWISRLTTLVVVVIIVAGAGLLIRSRMPKTQMGGRFLTYAKFREASRLQIGSRVVIAGVRVGDITGLTIEGQFARVDMRLSDDLQLPADSFATRRADTLFGDSYVEIIPSSGAEGARPVRMLKSGEPILHVEEGGSTDATLRTIARTMPKIDNAIQSAHELMIGGRKWVNGPLLDAMKGMDRWVSEGRIEGPLASADRAMQAFDEGTTGAAKAVSEAAPAIAKGLVNFDKGVTNARTNIKEAKQGIVTALTDARAGFDRADEAIDNMGQVMAAIHEGKGEDWKGTLGRLVNDPELGNTLEELSDDAAEGAANLNRFKSWIGAKVEVSVRTGDMRYYASAEMHARTDKFYLVEFEKSALGGAPFSDLSDVPGSDQFTRRQEIEEKLRFTLQFGKRLGFMQLRAGLKDSTAGVGADALFFNGRLRLSSDLFGSFSSTPRLKVAGAFAVFRSIYILAGIDDALNAPGELNIRTGNSPVPEVFKELKYGRDYFLGASLRFTDADLSTFLRFYGALVTGFLLTQ